MCVVSVFQRCSQCWSFHGHIFWPFSPWCHFLKFYSFKVLFQTQIFDDFPLWLFCLKVPHQQEFYLIRTKTFDELLTHKWKYLSQKMIQEIRQTSVFDARRTTLFCPVCNRIFQQNSFLKCFFTRFLREQDKIRSILARFEALWLRQFVMQFSFCS